MTPKEKVSLALVILPEEATSGAICGGGGAQALALRPHTSVNDTVDEAGLRCW